MAGKISLIQSLQSQNVFWLPDTKLLLIIWSKILKNNEPLALESPGKAYHTMTFFFFLKETRTTSSGHCIEKQYITRSQEHLQDHDKTWYRENSYVIVFGRLVQCSDISIWASKKQQTVRLNSPKSTAAQVRTKIYHFSRKNSRNWIHYSNNFKSIIQFANIPLQKLTHILLILFPNYWITLCNF